MSHRFAANIHRLFAEHSLPDRFEAAASAGLEGVYWPMLDGLDLDQMIDRQRASGIAQVQLNMPWRDTRGGGGGANDPRAQKVFRADVESALELAGRLDCPTLLCMLGTWVEGMDQEMQSEAMVENLRFVADASRLAGLGVVIEPINRIDMPGCVVASWTEAETLIRDVDRPNVSILADVYHLRRSGFDVERQLARHLPLLGMVELSDLPGRHQPGLEKSTSPCCSASSMALATRAGSVSSTRRWGRPRPRWVSCGATGRASVDYTTGRRRFEWTLEKEIVTQGSLRSRTAGPAGAYRRRPGTSRAQAGLSTRRRGGLRGPDFLRSQTEPPLGSSRPRGPRGAHRLRGLDPRSSKDRSAVVSCTGSACRSIVLERGSPSLMIDGPPFRGMLILPGQDHVTFLASRRAMDPGAGRRRRGG